MFRIGNCVWLDLGETMLDLTPQQLAEAKLIMGTNGKVWRGREVKPPWLMRLRWWLMPWTKPQVINTWVVPEGDKRTWQECEADYKRRARRSTDE